MKRVAFFLIFSVLIGCMFISCKGETADWNKIKIGSVGTIKYPSEWVATQKYSYMYFSDKSLDDKDCKVYLTQEYTATKNSSEISQNPDLGIKSSSVDSKQELSNGSSYGTKTVITADKQKTTVRFASLSDSKTEVSFTVTSEFDEEILLLILKSFEYAK